MKQTIKFTGTIIADTGVSVSRPNDNFMGGGHSDKVSRLPRTGSKKQDTGVYIPGATLRGKLRRAGQDRIAAYLKQGVDGPVFSLDEHYMLRQGVDISGETIKERSAGTIDKESSLREANPFLSLFGRWKIAGHLGVYGLHPLSNDCLMVDGKGARSNDFIRTPERIGLLSSDDQAKLQLLLEQDAVASLEMEPIKAKVKELKKEIKNTSEISERDAINVQIEELEQQQKAIKDNKISREAIQRPLDGYEMVKPGTSFEHQMILQNSTADELGLFIESLAEFARNPQVGAHASHGCGRVSMSYDITTFPELADEPVLLGKITVNEKGFKLTDLTDDKSLTEARVNLVNKIKSGEFDFGKFLLDK